MKSFITQHIDLWTSAQATKTSGRGISASNQQLLGIQKLRELILELAVRGKLVPQNANDEPAGELLKRIEVEKKRLVKEGKIKKQEILSEVEDDEKLFELPVGWVFCRLGTIFNSIVSGGTPSKSNPGFWNGDIPWASVKDLGKLKYIEKTQDYITQKGLDSGSKLAEIDDVIICTRMGLGKIAIAKVKLAINQDLKAVKLSSNLDVDYFLYFFSTLKIIGTGTTVAGITQDKLVNYPFPLPPLPEQHRIVAKVDELMALCDTLEKEQTSSNAAHETLVENLLGILTNARDTNDFQEAWQRIAEYFDLLFTTEHSIDKLKQTILQLAVMGKLVPQNPNDEPASVLLKKIAAEKAKLVKEGKIKKQVDLPKITEEEKPFELPKGWEWVKCQDICSKITDGEHITPNRSVSGFYLLSARNVTNEGIILEDVDFVPADEFERIRRRCDPNIGDILISCSGSVGRVALVDKDNTYTMVRSAALIRPFSNCFDNEYLAILIRSTYLQIQIKARSRQSAQANLFLGAISNLVFVIPPLTEQHHIVSKVDELFALCDNLKERIREAQVVQNVLAGEVVNVKNYV